jgi:K+-sensing histidine kinase KdpD
VRDDGPGIDEKDIPHPFDRFFAKGESRADSRRGIGLAFSIAKSIITAHGGESRLSTLTPMVQMITCASLSAFLNCQTGVIFSMMSDSSGGWWRG